MVLPVMMARRSMKFSLTDQDFSSPSFLRADSIASCVQSVASRTVSCSAAKASVSSRVLFLGRKISSVGTTSSRKKKVEVAELAERLNALLHEGGDVADIVVAKDAGADGLEEGFGRHGAEVLAVEPLELGEVEDGAAETNVFEDEVLDHLGEGELFRSAVEVCRYAAAHEAEEVDEGFGQVAALAVVDERYGVFALGDL